MNIKREIRMTVTILYRKRFDLVSYLSAAVYFNPHERYYSCELGAFHWNGGVHSWPVFYARRHSLP